jgi:5-methyltetrahydrofolate--homocysteine methyltransferase
MTTSLFHDLLSSRGCLLADGATGTNYFQMGLLSGTPPETWNLDRPELVRELHKRFIDAGADIILTNSFGGNRHRLKLHQAQDQVREINSTAAALARAEADGASRPVIVAGSMGPTGELFEPLGSLTYADGMEAFAAQAEALAGGGANVLWIETISSEEELRAAFDGASRTGLPIVVTMSFDTNGRTMMGITPQQFGALTASFSDQLAAFGANCGTGAAELVATILGITSARPDAIVVAKGNCGIPELRDGRIVYSGTPELMTRYVQLALDAGARIVGGCCGTTPEHLAAMSNAMRTYSRGARPSVELIESQLGSVSALAKGRNIAAEAKERRERRRLEQG